MRVGAGLTPAGHRIADHLERRHLHGCRRFFLHIEFTQHSNFRDRCERLTNMIVVLVSGYRALFDSVPLASRCDLECSCCRTCIAGWGVLPR